MIRAVLAYLALTASLCAAEFRGAWVASVYNIDWPSKPGLSAGQQQAELREMLDKAKAIGLNAILFQVRPMADAVYESRIEPWSGFISGSQGSGPGYDPLEFAIREAHARGLELHAWFNPFRAATKVDGPFAKNHISRTHPEWIRRHGSLLWIDPGEPGARDYVLSVVMDVVKRYAIDGVHIDDYFYPYPAKGVRDFADDKSWDRYGTGSGLSRADWRRDNINRFVATLYKTVKAEKANVKVGISPFGIYRPGVPATIEAGLDAYSMLYCDPKLWLEKGWCDYLAPQLYWSIEPAKQSFPVLLDWWRAQSKAGRPVWPGIATGRIGDKRPAKEIANQIKLTRQGTDSPGHIHWSIKSLMQNRGGVSDLLTRDIYGK
ncbi:MAG TPA: family 10 glycosylhydrolase [Chthoniobacteraceae bacterium]|nr:family 10 glycosylhydrolase [Chthoniobacteraceae bacterium]